MSVLNLNLRNLRRKYSPQKSVKALAAMEILFLVKLNKMSQKNRQAPDLRLEGAGMRRTLSSITKAIPSASLKSSTKFRKIEMSCSEC